MGRGKVEEREGKREGVSKSCGDGSNGSNGINYWVDGWMDARMEGGRETG